MILGDYIRSEFRSLHHDEPLNTEDTNWLVSMVRRKFPDVTREQVINASPFRFQEMKTYKFVATKYIEAHNEQEAQEKFANNSMDFAGSADMSIVN